MPKPKLPEEDKKEVVPLRLAKEAVNALHDLAHSWGEKRGKEVKPATVARELVLIGLDVVAAAQRSRMLVDLLQQGAEIDRASKIRQTLNQSMTGEIGAEELARQVLTILRSEYPALNTPSPDQIPDDSHETHEVYTALPGREPLKPHRKGGGGK